MIVGFYLFWAVVAYVAARAWLVPPARRGSHAWLVVLLAGLGFAANAALSDLVGVPIFRIGTAVSQNIPDDYLARGPAGWAVMAVAVLGAASPLLAALPLRRRPQLTP